MTAIVHEFHFARFSFAGVLSLILTFVLFFAMQSLVKFDGEGIKYTPTPDVVFRVDPPKPVKPPTREKIKRPVEVKHPPPLPTIDNNIKGLNIVSWVDNPDQSIDDGTQFTFEQGNSEAVQLVFVKPVYPNGPLTRGIEGHVVLNFIVGRDGKTKDIKVIESNPPSMFDRAAIRAVQKSKYKPAVSNGKPIESKLMEVKLRFAIEK